MRGLAGVGFILFLMFLMSSCNRACTPKPEPEPPEVAKARVAMEEAVEAARQADAQAYAAATAEPNISASAKGRVCRAAIAALMGRSPSIIKVTKTDGDIIHTRYTRSDGTVWKNQCWIRAQKVDWASGGSGNSTGRWRYEDDVRYRIEPSGKIWVRVTTGGELVSEDTYSVR